MILLSKNINNLLILNLFKNEEIKIKNNNEIMFLNNEKNRIIILFNYLSTNRKEKVIIKSNKVKNLIIKNNNQKIIFTYLKLKNKHYELYFELNFKPFNFIKLNFYIDNNEKLFQKLSIINISNEDFIKNNKILLNYNHNDKILIRQYFLNYNNIVKSMFSSGAYVFRINFGLYR
jgi:hypothetical protein